MLKQTLAPAIALSLALLLGACGSKPAPQAEAEQKLADAEKQLADAQKQLDQTRTTTQADADKRLADARRKLAEAQKEVQQARAEAAAAPAPAASKPPAAPPPPREITLPAGTPIVVRTTTALSTKTAANGAPFAASLEKDLTVDGRLIAPKGAEVAGVVVNSDPGGRVKGVASIAVTLTSITTPAGPLKVDTNNRGAQAKSTVKKDVIKGGIMTGVGAAIGAIAGGGKGAAIGAGAGAAAGTGTAMATRGDPAVIPAESVLTFTLQAPATALLK